MVELEITAMRDGEFLNKKTISIGTLNRLSKLKPSLPGWVKYELVKSGEAVWVRGSEELHLKLFVNGEDL